MKKIKRDEDNYNRQNGELNSIFEKFTDAITALENRMDKVEEDRLSQVEARLDRVEARLDRMDEKLDKLIRLVENGRKN